jgi:hypothetical protein
MDWISQTSHRSWKHVTTCVEASWELVREISYVAVSKKALDILIKCAKYQRAQEVAATKMTLARRVGEKYVETAVENLRECTLNTTLIAAFSSTALDFTALPRRTRQDHTPPTEALGFLPIDDTPALDFAHQIRSEQGISKTKKNLEPNPIRYSRRKDLSLSE